MTELDIVLVANDPDMGPTRILNSKTLGVGGRSIPFIEQIDVCWKSLFTNWDPKKISFTAWQLHTEPLGERMKAMLRPYEEKGLRVLQVDPIPYHPLGLQYNRAVAFVCPELKSRQRMIIDADLIFQGTPPLDLGIATAAMWASPSGPGSDISLGQSLRNQAQVMFEACGVPYPAGLYLSDYDQTPHTLYHLGDNRRSFPPMFNMGLFTLRRDLCPMFFDRFVKYVPRLFACSKGHRYTFQWLAPQYAVGLILVTMTLDWHVLPRGVNFLPVLMPSQQAIDAGVEITVYHYANADNGKGLEPELYGHWFESVPDYVLPHEINKPAGLPAGKRPGED